MKRKYISCLIACCMAFAGCEDMMNTQPEGANKTDALKEDAYSKIPENAAADISAIYAIMIQEFAGLGDYGYERHNDFGLASCLMLIEAEGQDWVGPNIGYNWFGYSDFANHSTTSYGALQVWNMFYKIIYACNTVISSIPADAEDATLLSNRGQALALRAYCYTTLAQLYQFTCSNEANLQKPCVPIVRDGMTADELTNNPRQTVEAVYKFIMEDLDEAIVDLDGYYRADKGMVDQAVAYGFRARVNLLLNNGQAAADDAAKAIALSGAQPYTRAEVSQPTFCSATANSVIWANIIVESNDIVQSGIVNWPSHMSSLFTDGYTGAGAYRSIASALYDQIPATDVRHGWWLDENLSSPLLENNNYSVWKEVAESDPSMQYVNVKFGVAGDNMQTLTAAADWILMRYEEMLFVQAEGLAMAGKEGEAKALLENFVQQNRDPKYTCTGDVREAIWLQRRIELWGEGFAFFDLQRLEKPTVRTNSSNWPAAWVVDVPANHSARLWVIPQKEIEANDGISEQDNNPFVSPL